MSKLTRRTFCAASSMLLASSAMAQANWPNRPITMIVPFAAAGSNDIIGRAIANEMAQSLKVPVVVENRPGAGSMLGAGLVAKAAPDGYTIMLASSTITIGVALKQGLPFDGRKDFTPIALAASGPLVLVGSPKLPVKSPAEFVALAKSQPNKLTYGSSGSGSLPHMGIELMTIAGGFQLLHVPYKGGAPVLNDIMAGTIDLYLGSMPQVLPLLRAGKLKAIGHTTTGKLPLLPDVISMGTAIPNYSFDLWWGVFGPGGMPAAIVNRLNAEVNKALQSPAIRKFAETEGVTPGSHTAAQFAQIYQKEIKEWEDLGKKTTLKLE